MKCGKCNKNEAVMTAYGPTYCYDCRHGINIDTSVKKNNKNSKIKNKKKLVNASVHVGDGIEYFDGSQQKYISKGMLKHIQSQIITHEGETLRGEKGRRYMDKYSKKYLGKNLAGSYNNTVLKGYV